MGSLFDFRNKSYLGFYHILAVSFCFIFVLSNIAAAKVTVIFGVFLDTGTAYFPLLYIINDITTEIYGFRASRKIIWLSIITNILFVFMLSFAVSMPSIPDSGGVNAAFDTIFSLSPRILVASVTSFLIGEYINSLILATSKIKFKGRFFGVRAIFSTLIGVSVESILFSTIAFYGKFEIKELVSMTALLIAVKVLYEVITIPITAKIVSYLKKQENMDYYDTNTKFNILPF